MPASCSSAAPTMPAMAAAYASLDEDAIARAASALNVVKRLGGPVGVALIAVVLEHHLPGAAGSVGDRPGPVTDAFQRSSWWLVGFSVLALVAAAFLPRRPRDGGGDADERGHAARVAAAAGPARSGLVSARYAGRLAGSCRGPEHEVMSASNSSPGADLSWQSRRALLTGLTAAAGWLDALAFLNLGKVSSLSCPATCCSSALGRPTATATCWPARRRRSAPSWLARRRAPASPAAASRPATRAAPWAARSSWRPRCWRPSR